MRANLLFYVPALFTTLATIGLGGLFAMIAWTQVLIEPPPEAPRRIELALLALTAAVLVDMLAMPVMWGFSDAEQSTIWMLFLLASFALAGGSVFLLRRHPGAGRSMVKIGSILLVTVDFLGMLGIISGLPKH